MFTHGPNKKYVMNVLDDPTYVGGEKLGFPDDIVQSDVQVIRDYVLNRGIGAIFVPKILTQTDSDFAFLTFDVFQKSQSCNYLTHRSPESKAQKRHMIIISSLLKRKWLEKFREKFARCRINPGNILTSKLRI